MFEKRRATQDTFFSTDVNLPLIGELSVIKERFDSIKTHRPKATKKLKELGILIGSAYKINPAMASEMWEYLIDLNVKENPDNTTFYILSVARKLFQVIGVEDTVDLLQMSKDRALLCWQNLPASTLFYSFVCPLIYDEAIDKAEELVIAIHEGIKNTPGDEELYLCLIEKFLDVDFDLKTEEKNYLTPFLRSVFRVAPQGMRTYTKFVLVSKGKDEYCDLELIDKCAEYIGYQYNYASRKTFLKLVTRYKDQIDMSIIIAEWIKVIDKCHELNFYYPDVEDLHIHESWETTFLVNIVIDGVNYYKPEEQERPIVMSTPEYEASSTYLAVRILMSNEQLLKRYFSDARSLTIKQDVLYHWICDDNWEMVVKYLTMNYVHYNRECSSYDNPRKLIDVFLGGLNKSTSGVSTRRRKVDNYGRDWDIINENKWDSFIDAIEQICKGCEGYEYHQELISLLNKCKTSENKCEAQEL